VPVVGFSPYNVAEDVANLVRVLCNDQQGQLYTDTYIQQAVNSAYRKMQLSLMNVGKQTFTNDNYIVTIPAIATVDPGKQVFLGFAGIGGNIPSPANLPTLPQNLVEPLMLWERPTGTTDIFIPMENLTAHGGVPSLPQTFNLRFWAWQADQIILLGAEQDTDIRIRFEGSFSMFTIVNGVLNGTLQVLTAIDAVAYAASANILEPRGSPLVPSYRAQAMEFIELLKNQEARAQQHAGPYRRRGFSSRYGIGRGWY